jgi:uncharacterized protein (UPF0332 family)
MLPAMSNQEMVSAFLAKAAESLAGAESEYDNKRYQNAANRAYYACYQAAVAALIASGIRPDGPRWSHETVQALFSRELVTRRKRYPSALVGTFEALISLRNIADYDFKSVSEVRAFRSVQKARRFVESVQSIEGKLP